MAEEFLHREQHHAGRDGRVPERREDNRRGLLGQPRNARNFFGPNVAEIEHHAQRGLGFLDAFGRKLNVVRVGPDGAIEVIGRNGIERAPCGGQRQKLQPAGSVPENLGTPAGSRQEM
jgi:hypothetical protein